LGGPISLFLEKRGEGMHHVAYAVADIRGEMQRLRREGFQLLNEEPKLGADGKWVCFIHPRGVSGVLSELCQDRD
jgi:methylmalonyl-CoA/ethylmalonyl-CoA epimerase